MDMSDLLDIEPPQVVPPNAGNEPLPDGSAHDALANIGALVLALARINGGAGSAGLLRLGKAALERLSDLEKAKFEGCVAEAETGWLDIASKNRSG